MSQRASSIASSPPAEISPGERKNSESSFSPLGARSSSGACLVLIAGSGTPVTRLLPRETTQPCGCHVYQVDVKLCYRQHVWVGVKSKVPAETFWCSSPGGSSFTSRGFYSSFRSSNKKVVPKDVNILVVVRDSYKKPCVCRPRLAPEPFSSYESTIHMLDPEMAGFVKREHTTNEGVYFGVLETELGL